jgi:hypothetical protein
MDEVIRLIVGWALLLSSSLLSFFLFLLSPSDAHRLFLYCVRRRPSLPYARLGVTEVIGGGGC